MKRGKKFLLYISSITFCCLFLFFVTNNKVDAIDDSAFAFSCIDKNKIGDDKSCDAETIEFYYRLDSITVDDGEISGLSELIIPSTHTITIDNGENPDIELTGNVEEIASNVIISSSPLTLETLTLPNKLRIINDSALTNIESLIELEIPTSMEYIGTTIFADNASITNIYLNEYEYDSFEYIEIASGAFDNANLTRIICGDHDVYKFFFSDEDSSLKGSKKLVAEVTYTYYTSENETLLQQTGTKKYYLGEGQIIDEVFDPIIISGMRFMGWYVKISGTYQKIAAGGPTYYIIETTNYDVYPKFELTPLDFSISAKDSTGANVLNSIKYDGSSTLVHLEPINITHTLMSNSDFNTSVKWVREFTDGSAVEVSNEDDIYLSAVQQSGKYNAIITYSYVYDGVTYSAETSKTRDITITKAPLYVNIDNVTKVYGTYIQDSDISYSITGLLGADVIDSNSVRYTYSKTGRINVGSYVNDIKVSIDSIKESGSEKIYNYDFIYSYGTYIVTPKLIDVYYTKELILTYGDDIAVYSDPYVFNDVYGNLQDQVVITFAKEAGSDVGEYKIKGVKAISDENYLPRYVDNLTTGKVVIKPKKVEIHMEIDSYVYDGSQKDINMYYYDINNVKTDAIFEVRQGANVVDDVVNSGDYVAVATSLGSSNYAFTSITGNKISFTIEKAIPVVDYSAYQRYTYNGNKIYPFVRINNSEQEPIYSCLIGGRQGDYCINAGIYDVVVNYKESANYKAHTLPSIRLDISRYVINVSPKSFTFYYGEDVVASEEITINGETVIAKYTMSATKGSEVGNYNITNVTIKNLNSSTDHVNYVGSLVLTDGVGKVKIVSRPATIVYYNYTDLVYNGKERVVGAYLVDNLSSQVVSEVDVEVVCDEGIIKDAKTYHLRAYFNDPHYSSVNTNLLTFNIAKATYDVSNIKFEDKKFKLDFNKHSIHVEGNLPEGVSVNYTIDGEEGNSTSSAFSHKVVASFIIDEQNYLPIDNLEATIYIDMTWVFVTIVLTLMTIAIAFALAYMYVRYRREHPKKIKFKIKNLVQEDLEAKRVATSVKDVLGDEEVEHEIIESEDDIVEENAKLQSFIDRIYAADSELKYYYSEVKNELLSYAGITHTVDRKYEVFNHGTRQIAKLSICNGVLKLYVNLDPDKYDKKLYNHRDMSKIDCHARTPLRIDVNTVETLRHAKVFIRILRKKENLKAQTSFVKIDYEKFYTLKENFIPRIFKKITVGNKKKSKKE